MEINVKTFDALRPDELYSLLQLRTEIFVLEQQCLYQDMDGKDKYALHVLGWIGTELVACTRVFAPGDYFNEASIGRVAVRFSHRGKGLGVAIMEASLKTIEARFGRCGISLSAQSYLKKFYLELGFNPEGAEYLEDGIPHIRMTRPVTRG